MCRRVFASAHVLDDCWQEEREGVERHVSTHVDDHPEVHFPVRESGPEVFHLELLMLGAGLLVFFQAAQDADAFLGSQEGGGVGEVMDHEEGEEAEAHRDDTFDYEDPCPARATSSSV